MAIEHTIDPNLTISSVVQQYPQTLKVFNDRGLDVCCGGGLAVTEAARRHGLDLAELLAALAQAGAGGQP